MNLQSEREHEYRIKNRQLGHNALTSALSAFYAKLIVVLGIAFPVTDVLAVKAPNAFYQGFYLYLYTGSIAFVVFMYIDYLRTRRIYTANNANGEFYFCFFYLMFAVIYDQLSILCFYVEPEKRNLEDMNHAKARLGSFYLRVGAVAFGIGSMVYSGLEFGQYFELKGKIIQFYLEIYHFIDLLIIISGDPSCQNVFIALTPATRMVLSIVQMQFIFLNTKEFELKRHQAIVRFGLMHMLATNLCEWLYVLVEETKHEIINLTYSKQSTPGKV